MAPPSSTLTVASKNPNSGVNISVSPNDNSNQGNGVTQFTRTYSPNTNVTLTAPATAGLNTFQKWQRNGVDWTTNPSTSVTLDTNYTMTAVYVTPSPLPRTLTLASLNLNSGVTMTVNPIDNNNQGEGATPFTRTFNHGTNVTLTAPPAIGNDFFVKWQRNGVNWSSNTLTSVFMDADYTMTAIYMTAIDEPPFVPDPALAGSSGFSTVDWTVFAEPSIVDWINLFRTDAAGGGPLTMPSQNPERCEVNALCRALRVGHRSFYSFY